MKKASMTLAFLLDLLMLNLMNGGTHPAEKALEWARWAKRRLDQLNPAPRARRNVAHHYDLNGRLYALFLDRDRQYSCAYFQTGNESLEEAQMAKKRHIAAKLKLDRPGLEVLDIGCGWGGMALTLAREWGAQVTGITLSTEQLAVARARAEEAGLSRQVRFALMDYRDWRQPVDRIVSVGMFEHVGLQHYPGFFRLIRRALKPQGVAPGDATSDQMRVMADIGERYALDDIRVAHEQDIVYPHVKLDDVPQVAADIVAGKVKGRVVVDIA